MPKNLGLYNNDLSVPRKKDLNALETRIKTNEDDIAMAQSDIEGLSGDVGTLKTDVGQVKTALGSKQDTVVGGASTIVEDNLTANRALVSDASGKVATSEITSTELGYLSGVTSNAQDQFNGKVSKSGDTMTGNLTVGSAKLETNGYVTSTWLKTTANVALSAKPSQIAVINGGWIYSRTPAQIKSDIGLGNVDNVKQYAADNPPPYPVTSVNTKTGEVILTASDVGALPDTTTIPTNNNQLTNGAGYITAAEAPVTSVNGMTGAVTIEASGGFKVLAQNATDGVANDTTAKWVELGPGYSFFSQDGQLVDQPQTYGFVVNYVYGSDVFQIWSSQNQGPIYYRTGNAGGWGISWRKFSQEVLTQSSQPSGQQPGTLWFQT